MYRTVREQRRKTMGVVEEEGGVPAVSEAEKRRSWMVDGEGGRHESKYACRTGLSCGSSPSSSSSSSSTCSASAAAALSELLPSSPRRSRIRALHPFLPHSQPISARATPVSSERDRTETQARTRKPTKPTGFKGGHRAKSEPGGQVVQPSNGW